MGAAIDALTDVGTFLKHNPVILAVGWVASVTILMANAVLGQIPLLGQLLSVFLGPVFLAGMLGTIYAGRDGSASTSDFVESLRSHYLRLLGGSLVVGGVMLVVGVGGLLATVFAMSFGSTTGRGTGPAAMVGAALIPLLAIGVVLGLFYTVVQFFDVAIVVEDAGVVESFRRSVELLAAAPLSVLGYTVLRAVVGALFVFAPLVVVASAVGGVVSAASAGSGLDGLLGAAGLAVVALLLVWFLVLLPLGQIVGLTYHVAYFNRHKALETI